ncbi:AAA family ATPase [Catellatospora sp. TT07R-123]|uniref:AAA family ATPase n=1 Tax=Catellatospora sp. TT07R-123 TaxID=2733863 RepID=UPI001BB3B9E7|nr:LuxR family transcriptional regulator [Catellatospora sp. TT07R-123]
MDSGAMLGRSEEQEQCWAQLRTGGSVLLRGPGGIGKSTLLAALAALAAHAGELVLRACPTAAERELPYLALIDLFGAVLPQLSALPQHLREALDSALLRAAPPTGRATDQLAIRVAVVEGLRLLAAERPVLLVLDDSQFLDEASAEVLAFAARRLAGTPVRVLAAELVDEGAVADSARFCPAPLLELEVSALPSAALRRLLADRMAQPLPAVAADRVCAASGGNPLFALELARAALHARAGESPDDPLPVPQRLRALLAERLAALPAAAGPALLLVATGAKPGREMLPDNDPGLAAALAAGILAVEPDGVLRFSHPLLAELVYGDASPRARRTAHARLAALVEDPVESARHRALAAARPDEALAEQLVAAARIARDRGAPATAATLCRLAAARSPDPDRSARRLLACAEHAAAAGLTEQARATCAAVLRRTDRTARVGARLLLADLLTGTPDAIRVVLDAAAPDAEGDPLLMGLLHAMRADVLARDKGVAVATPEVDEAERLARKSGDADLLLEVMAHRLQVEMQGDTGGELPALAEALPLAQALPLHKASVWVRMGYAIVQMRRGDMGAAVEAARRFTADAERAGRTRDLARTLYTASSIYHRAGLCAEAGEAGRLCALLWREVDLPPTGALVMAGAAELNNGTVEQAAAHLADAVVLGGSMADREWEAYALIFLGRCDLLRRDAATAARNLERGRQLLAELGYHDPTMILVDADLAEALALAGEAARARELLAVARAAALRQNRTVVLLGLDRVEALLDGLSGDARQAADRLRALMAAPHPYPLERLRCALVLAALERRARRRGAARAALTEALDGYEQAGCAPYIRFARQELARLDAGETDLSDADRRLLELLRSGATNRAIAGAMHLSVKAVEANLTRLYRRYGVPNRAALLRVTD